MHQPRVEPVATSDLTTQLHTLAARAKQAARPLARAAAATRTGALMALAQEITAAQQAILRANQRDLEAAKAHGLSAAMCDRVLLNEARLEALAQSVQAIAAQPDPLGAVSRAWRRPNGLQVEKVRLPLGVILMIYEARPNVTVDAAALCLRSGNAVILRGGKEAAHSNGALAACIERALSKSGLPTGAVAMVPTQAHAAIDILLQCDESIDLVIPRGGEALIKRVVAGSRIPVVKHYKGICHVYIDAAADMAMAGRIVENAKVQRPGVCNALETLLVDQRIAAQFLPTCIGRLQQLGVRVRGCAQTLRLVPSVEPASEDDWDREYLDLILAVRVVDGVDAAIAHIDKHGTQHTATIVTESREAAERFLSHVDTSCVLVNASTRFNDGGELGLGAEMGISTTRVHAYGPMGVDALTAEKFVVRGSGQIRT